MQKNFVAKRGRGALLLALALASLSGCGLLRVGPPRPPAWWFIILDGSRSVDDFAQLRDELIPHTVLSRLRPGDQVWILRLDESTDDSDARYFSLSKGSKRVEQQMQKALTEMVQYTSSLLQSPHPGSDFLGGFRFVQRNVERLQGEREKRREAGKNPGPDPLIIVSFYTDGQVDQPGSEDLPKKFDPGVSFYFWGVDGPHMEAGLRDLAQRAGVTEDNPLFVYPLNDSEGLARSWGESFGRRLDERLWAFLQGEQQKQF